MPISGKVYIVPLPEEQSWQLVVHNTGDHVLGITQNVLPPHNPDLKAHDDHLLYGHGLPVNPGAVSWQKFQAGDVYTHRGSSAASHVVGPGSHLRVGLRGLAFKTVELPPLDGAPLELDLADFNWYGGNAQSSVPRAPSAYAGSRPRATNVVDGNAVLAQVRALIERANGNGIRCEGRAQVTAVRGPAGDLTHWEVRFENTGEQAWIGTCTFSRGQKNEGIGLESMGVPNKGSAAMQRIERFGNYGVEAEVGEKLRLGVRGYSWTEVKLPAEGTVELPLEKFKLDTSKMSPEYFDRGEVEKKRGEKKDKVQFFESGQAINAALEPLVLYGDEAAAKAEFDAPRLLLKPVKDGPETPGGGWLLTLESRLPEFDDQGRVGFVAAIKLDGASPDHPNARQLGPKKLQFPGHSKAWFIPAGADLGGAPAREGGEVHVATRGLGWFARVALPAKGKVVDSDKDPKVWGLREEQYARGALTPEMINRYRG